ncbi:hypothetical protein GCK72_020961 [Caenorhabditis remanei]|uniref:Cyclin N-terminal domain-containing protein n=1 Tax=Caenorhabditis remanei TaxID=31234 RepID=A0A6A5GGV7_CAERE|nr:hypothetical protein GCK72_020961 [Caenorhabditis remanei]KAF1754400.1 hypothetical protein GCK72_020961 [Caenorhabditis remanei]
MQTRADSISRVWESPMLVSTGYDNVDIDKSSLASSVFKTPVCAPLFSPRDDSEPSVDMKRDMVIRKKEDGQDEAMFSCVEYFSDIIKYMMHRQMRNRPSPNYQNGVNEEMRTILIDWFHDIVTEYSLKQETFHLACSLVDRFLSILNIDKDQFQLVGTTCLMIATKYEEVFPPEIREFSIITDNTYDVDEIRRMEKFLLAQLDFDVAHPTAAWFAACFGKKMKFTEKMTKTMRYLVDLSLLDVHFLRYRPSDIAAAAACFANVQLGREAWPKEMIQATGIDTDDFIDVLKDLHHTYINAPISKNKSIFNKYCETDEMEVALLFAPTY